MTWAPSALASCAACSCLSIIASFVPAQSVWRSAARTMFGMGRDRNVTPGGAQYVDCYRTIEWRLEARGSAADAGDRDDLAGHHIEADRVDQHVPGDEIG